LKPIKSLTLIRGVWIANQPQSQFSTSTDNIKQGVEKLIAQGFNTIVPIVLARFSKNSKTWVEQGLY
ncbi:MAG: hypothetical protein AAFY76_12515, partial [Cyanobacteria bacterium J06649_11]